MFLLLGLGVNHIYTQVNTFVISNTYVTFSIEMKINISPQKSCTTFLTGVFSVLVSVLQKLGTLSSHKLTAYNFRYSWNEVIWSLVYIY
jgi:hypothetical protein